MENPLLKTIIVVALAYYLIKGLIYLLLWQTTYKLQQSALERKKQKREARLEKFRKRREEKEAKEKEPQV